MRFAFIDVEKANYPVTALCRVLQVTTQGYYQWRSRPSSTRAESYRALRADVRRIHLESQRRYGSPRVHNELTEVGVRVSKRRVERAMRDEGLCARKRRRFITTTQRDESHPVVENILRRDFTATRPNEKWVGDITAVPLRVGFCYIAVIIDLFARKVVGWAVGLSPSSELALQALDEAAAKRRPAKGLCHHTDRGCQYTSKAYRDRLDELGAVVSMSRKGNCWDNAVAESFFSTLKVELLSRKSWEVVDDVRLAVFDYIESFYNTRRRHSTNGYLSPTAAERALATRLAA